MKSENPNVDADGRLIVDHDALASQHARAMREVAEQRAHQQRTAAGIMACAEAWRAAGHSLDEWHDTQEHLYVSVRNATRHGEIAPADVAAHYAEQHARAKAHRELVNGMIELMAAAHEAPRHLLPKVPE